MVITQPTIDNFSDTTVMRVIRKIVNYICSDSGLVAQINDNDITGFTSSYEDNVLKIDATKGDGSKLPVCNVTIEGGGSSTGNPYPTAVSGTVGADGNITFTVTMSSGSPLTTTIDMNYFASADDLSDLQEQVTGIKPIVTTNLESSPPTITVDVNGISSTANLPSGGTSGGAKIININSISELQDFLKSMNKGDILIGNNIYNDGSNVAVQSLMMCFTFKTAAITGLSGSGIWSESGNRYSVCYIYVESDKLTCGTLVGTNIVRNDIKFSGSGIDNVYGIKMNAI